MRFQGEHRPIQHLNIKVLCLGTVFCNSFMQYQFADISGRLCEVQEAAAEISAVSGWKIPLLTWKAPISHLHVQWWEAADVFFVNYFPCCICSVFLVILTRLFSLPVLSCLFLICAVWWVVVICVHPACCALGFTDEAPCMQRLLAIKG